MKQRINSILLVSILVIFAGYKENSQSSETENSASEEGIQVFKQTTKIPEGITTPDEVITSIGELKFLDGAPLPETAELVYDNLKN